MTGSWIRGLSLRSAIVLALLLGAGSGLALNYANKQARAASLRRQLAEGADPAQAQGQPLPFVAPLVRYVTRPIGQLFLSLLTMTVVPLVFASLAAGIARLGDLRKLGRIGLRALAFFVVSMSAAAAIGLALVNLVGPGLGVSEETQARLEEQWRRTAAEGGPKPAEFDPSRLYRIVPRNPVQAAVEMDMLGIIVFALFVGVGIASLPASRSQGLIELLQGISDVMVAIIGMVMMLAPIAVFALIFSVTVELGLELVRMLAAYVGVVVGGLALQLFGTLPLLLAVFGRVQPYAVLWQAREAAVTAFSTSSSSATLPTSLRVAQQQLGIPGPIAGFVLPLGATMNMNGTALFEGVTVLFLAQVSGLPMPLEKQALVVVMAVVTAIGAAGVPGGSIPLLMMVLAAVGLEPERIGLILGVDRLLDMCRTTLNVMGDVAAAAYVARAEGFPVATGVSASPPTQPQVPSGT
jgi:DAACS family dicarboxylate/amino acid:cation (Na+ or H+) symporter